MAAWPRKWPSHQAVTADLQVAFHLPLVGGCCRTSRGSCRPYFWDTFLTATNHEWRFVAVRRAWRPTLLRMPAGPSLAIIPNRVSMRR